MVMKIFKCSTALFQPLPIIDLVSLAWLSPLLSTRGATPWPVALPLPIPPSLPTKHGPS